MAQQQYASVKYYIWVSLLTYFPNLTYKLSNEHVTLDRHHMDNVEKKINSINKKLDLLEHNMALEHAQCAEHFPLWF